MTNPIVITQSIAGKKVSIVFIFEKYKPKHLAADFEELVEFQKKKGAQRIGKVTEQPLQKEELDFRWLNIKNWVPIPYDEFIKISTNLFSKALFYLVQQNPYLIVGEELVLEFKVIQIKNRDYYYAYNYAEKRHDPGSDIEHALFDIAGIWLLQAIAAPSFYLNRIDFSYVYRYFLHELTHHYDFARIQLAKIEADLVKTRKFVFNKEPLKKKYIGYSSVPSLPFIFESIFNLRIEGIADFNARRDFSRLNIDLNGIKQYNKNLLELTLRTKLNDIEELYNQKIGYGNLTPSGEYSNGRMMCLFIALAVAREKKAKYGIEVGKKKVYLYDANWGELLSANNVLFVTDLPLPIIEVALAKIQETNPDTFIDLYEQACQVLGITNGSHKIMTRERMLSYKNLAVENYLKVRSAARKKEGFE